MQLETLHRDEQFRPSNNNRELRRVHPLRSRDDWPSRWTILRWSSPTNRTEKQSKGKCTGEGLRHVPRKCHAAQQADSARTLAKTALPHVVAFLLPHLASRFFVPLRRTSFAYAYAESPALRSLIHSAMDSTCLAMLRSRL